MTKLHPLSGKRVLFMLCGFDLGGAERQALYLAKHLKSLGCDVRVWGHYHRHRGPERVISACEEGGIPWSECKFRWPCGKLALVRDALHVWYRLLRERPDIVLSYTTWPNMGVGLVWRWTPVRAFVWGQRDLAPMRGSFLERSAYRKASAVICNAGHEVQHLAHCLGVSEAPVHVVHNGVALPAAVKTRKEWRDELGIESDSVPVAAMVANLRTDKDHATLLHAWRIILERLKAGEAVPRLVLAGAPQEAGPTVHQLVRDLSLEGSVIVPGQIGDIAGLLSACDVGVLSTRAEGLPNAVLEYMTCGLPVVATDIPGNREALGYGAGEQLCIPGDAGSLASKLGPLLRDRELRSRLAAKNLERAKSEFTIERMCASTTTILQGLLLSAGGQTKRQTG